jgi:hypothetical protein
MNDNWRIVSDPILQECRNCAVGPDNLASELSKLRKLEDAGLPEAVAFFAGRVVEGLSDQAVAKAGLTPGSSVLENLDLLALTGRIDDGSLLCAHTIRRLANQARHLERQLHLDEEATIVALLQLWVEWFLRASVGRRDELPSAKVSADWSVRTSTLRVLAMGDQTDVHNLRTVTGALQPLLADAATAAFVAERLVDYSHPEAAEFVGQASLRFPRAKRITQVRALLYSRNGDVDRAIGLLLPLRRGYRRALDAETIGILGGAYKKKWMLSGDNAQLAAAHDTYAVSLPDSRDNYYLRINVAATALWLGHLTEARASAYAVIRLLSEFGVTTDGALAQSESYWILATLAEAQLLAGSAKQALSLYRRAKELDVTGGRWRTTCSQLVRHLNALPKVKLRKEFDEVAAT